MKNSCLCFAFMCIIFVAASCVTKTYAQEVLRLREDEFPDAVAKIRNRECAVLRIPLSPTELRQFNANPCGPYFMVALVHEDDSYRHDNLVTKIMCQLDDPTDTIASHWFLFKPSKFVVEIDDTKQTPTAMLVPTERGPNLAYDQVIVRISQRDYKQSPCLPKPSRTKKK